MGTDPAARAAVAARQLGLSGAQVKAFETSIPSARVVRLSQCAPFNFSVK